MNESEKGILNTGNARFEEVFTFDKNSQIPIYSQLVTVVLKGIEEKKFNPGDKMPSINQLSSFLHLSRDTIEKSYNCLKQIGILHATHGKGFFLCKAKAINLKKEFLIKNDGFENHVVYDAFFKSVVIKNNSQVYSNRDLHQKDHQAVCHEVSDIIQDLLVSLNDLPLYKLKVIQKIVENLSGNSLRQ